MLFLLAAYGIAIAVWPGFAAGRLPVWMMHAMRAGLWLTPFLISADEVNLRALGCVLTIDLYFKTIDYARQHRLGTLHDQRLAAYLWFLFPFPAMLVRFEPWPRDRLLRASDLFGLAVAVAVLVGCFGMIDWVAEMDVVRSSFLIDHTVKFVIFVVTMEALSRCLQGLERLAGYRIKPLIDDAFRSVTVGEFWRRYNTRVHDWLDANLFRPSGGLRAPVRAMFLTFGVSAVLHEIGFAIATSRVDGYQLAFFLLQAPAVLMGRRLQRLSQGNRSGSVLLYGLSVLWMWATSMLFFHGVNRVVPGFYAAEPWLP